MFGEYTSLQGCELSLADANHDFHEIFDASSIVTYVNENIPRYEGLDCKKLSEDAFVDKYELKLDKGVSSSNHKREERFIITHLSEEIQQRYAAYYVSRHQHDFSKNTSLLQECFQNAGLVNDIFFICDVAYANVREDLKFASDKIAQKFYWVQNAQTLYDPAGKTTWHSDKPYFEVEADQQPETSTGTKKKSPSSKSGSFLKCPNHFKSPNSNFLFCWQNAKKNIVTLYPQWNYPKKEDTYKFSQNSPEQMLYTNKTLFLCIHSANVNDYSSHEAYLIITDPTKSGYYGYADKTLAAKGSGILTAAELASYRAKGDDLKRFVKFIYDSKKNLTTTKLFLDELMNYSSTFQVLAKKVGDSSQSISCCQKKLDLQQFKDNVLGPNASNNIIDFESNGNHAFVSYDRIAIVSALNYNCPIVIGNTQEGFNVYIRKDLLNIHHQLSAFLMKNASGEYELLNQLKDPVNQSVFMLNRQLFMVINSAANGVKEKVSLACFNLNVIPKNDVGYQNFLISHFIELNVFQLFSNLDSTILNFREEFFVDKIKNIYADKIKEIVDTGLESLKSGPFTLGDIRSVNNINDLMVLISGNVTIILQTLNDKYESIKRETMENVSEYNAETNQNKDIYLVLLKIFKLVQQIVLNINEVQNILLTNVETMQKLIQFQDVIVASPDVTKLNVNARNLPKGVATNITSCTPFSYYVTNARTVRNSDLFFEKSTSIFGTTTVVLQIFNVLNCNVLIKLKERFVKILYNVLDELTIKATALANVSFISVINSAKVQLKELFIQDSDSVEIGEINPDNLISFLNLRQMKPIAETASGNLNEFTTTTVGAEKLSSATPVIDIFRKKKLFITAEASQSNDMTFRSRIDVIRGAGKQIRYIFNKISNTMRVNSTEIVEVIKVAYENETFIKGFVGLFAFMEYIRVSTGKKVPTLFTYRANNDQAVVLERIFDFFYKSLTKDAPDPDFKETLEKMEKDIQNKLTRFDLTTYNGFSPEEKLEYIKSNMKKPYATRKKIAESWPPSEMVVELNNYVSYYAQVKHYFDAYNELYELDKNPPKDPTDKNDFSVNSFRKLLEMNVITVGDKVLEGFDGINANQINVNVALLYFIENRIASMNDEPLPHPELVGLFSQLFLGSSIYPQEYIKKDAKFSGGGEDLFDVMEELFMSDDVNMFNDYRKKSYLLLNMPNNYEIAINNFQFYPSEIKAQLYALKRDYEVEMEREEERTQFKTKSFAKSMLTGNELYKNPVLNVPQIIKPIPVFGGKTRKNKLRTKNKSRKNKLWNKRHTRKNKLRTKNKSRK